jgi:hypothetical protein
MGRIKKEKEMMGNIEIVQGPPCVEVKGEDLKIMRWALVTCCPIANDEMRARLENLLERTLYAIEEGER